MDWLKIHGHCAACLAMEVEPMEGVCDPAHTEFGGMAQKGPDESCAPLCHPHHLQYDGQAKLPNGELGHEAFEQVLRA